MSTKPERSLPRILSNHHHMGLPARLSEVMDEARQTKFDGTLTIHYRGGVPRRVEAGRPDQVELVADLSPLPKIP